MHARDRQGIDDRLVDPEARHRRRCFVRRTVLAQGLGRIVGPRSDQCRLVLRQNAVVMNIDEAWRALGVGMVHRRCPCRHRKGGISDTCRDRRRLSSVPRGAGGRRRSRQPDGCDKSVSSATDDGDGCGRHLRRHQTARPAMLTPSTAVRYRAVIQPGSGRGPTPRWPSTRSPPLPHDIIAHGARE